MLVGNEAGGKGVKALWEPMSNMPRSLRATLVSWEAKKLRRKTWSVSLGHQASSEWTVERGDHTGASLFPVEWIRFKWLEKESQRCNGCWFGVSPSTHMQPNFQRTATKFKTHDQGQARPLFTPSVVFSASSPYSPQGVPSVLERWHSGGVFIFSFQSRYHSAGALTPWHHPVDCILIQQVSLMAHMGWCFKYR